MTDIVDLCDIDSALRYGDIEPLLKRLESNGLDDPAARKLVADLARGRSPRGRGEKITDRATEQRNDLARMLVANRRGLLQRDNRDPRRAFSEAAMVLQQTSAGEISARQIKRVWGQRGKSASLRLAHRLGKEGIKIDP